MRTLQVDDLFRLEELGEGYYGDPFSFSPDGKTLAYVLQRPKATATLHKWSRLAGNDRADIWLVDLPGGTPHNLTNGVEQGIGYWAPSWSPDGARLAMLSTKGDNVTLWVWEQASGQLRQLTERGVALEFDRAPYTWLSPETIFCPVLPQGKQPDAMSLESRAAEQAMRAWPSAWAGQNPTASVLQSAVPVDLSKRPQGELLLIDVVDRSRTVLARGIMQEFTLSPDKQWVAFLQAIDIYRPKPDVLLRIGERYRFAVRVTSTQGVGSEVMFPDTDPDVLPFSLRWSPDSSEVAFIGYGTSRIVPPRVYSVRPADGSVHTFGGDSFDPSPPEGEDPRLLWSSSGELLVHAAGAQERGKSGPRARRDWWVVDREGGERSLTTAMPEPPTALCSERSSQSFVGLAGGKLWRIHLAGSPPENLTEELAAELSGIVWSGGAGSDDRQGVDKADTQASRLILSAQRGTVLDYYLVDLPAGATQQLPKPLLKATVASYDPGSETVLFTANDHTGTYLWSAQRPYRDCNLLLETNTFLRDITPGEHRQIEYRSLDGEDLTGWLLLPPNYQPGQRYPLIVEVYPGSVQEPSPKWHTELNNAFTLNMQLLAADGYVVLHPSMPLAPDGESSDPLLDLPKGVLPAVDRVVELGIADLHRTFLMGHSYGGYGTYGLVTQTCRFRAAVALAGFADLISLYGTFEGRIRYDDDPHEDLFDRAYLETGQGRMGNPPWKDLGRYLRNSPIFYVDRVQTPPLIIHGDLDFISLQQSEEFFLSLYRQDKRAAFVRYWGEGHVLESPANVKDMWQRILAWFAEFDDAGEE